jgi:hypothetical protein
MTGDVRGPVNSVDYIFSTTIIIKQNINPLRHEILIMFNG